MRRRWSPVGVRRLYRHRLRGFFFISRFAVRTYLLQFAVDIVRIRGNGLLTHLAQNIEFNCMNVPI